MTDLRRHPERSEGSPNRPAADAVSRQLWSVGGAYCVYILSSARRTLYIGITNDIERRLFEYRSGISRGFVTKYNVHRLVHLEEFGDPVTAIAREKEIKGWVRRRKVALIEESNPEWKDLSES